MRLWAPNNPPTNQDFLDYVRAHTLCEIQSARAHHIISFIFCDAPHPGSVDYPSTRRIQVDVGLPDATLENRVESPLYGELYPNTIPV